MGFEHLSEDLILVLLGRYGGKRHEVWLGCYCTGQIRDDGHHKGGWEATARSSRQGRR